MNLADYTEIHDTICVQMLNGAEINHELYARINGAKVKHVVVMASGISRGAENDKTFDLKKSSAMWLDYEGVATFRVSPTGMGASEGDTFESCLRDRIKIIEQATHYALKLYPNTKLTLVGVSMGAHVVVRAAHELMTNGINVSTLVLSSPCLYSDLAESAKYGVDFRQAAMLSLTQQPREDFSAVKQLGSFPGREFVFYQQFDDDMQRGGVPDIDKIVRVVGAVMQQRAEDGYQDIFRTIDGGEHAFRLNGVNPDITTIDEHSGSSNKQYMSQEVARFIGLDV